MMVFFLDMNSSDLVSLCVVRMGGLDLFGSYWDDDIYGSGGDDYISGEAGDDILDGGKGNDILYGGTGDDILWAGYGQDELIGGSGYDIFGFYAGGNFVIEDFSTASDMLFFDSTTTGIDCVNDLLDAISGVDETYEGVIIDFYGGASIEMVGVYWHDLTNVVVDFG